MQNQSGQNWVDLELKLKTVMISADTYCIIVMDRIWFLADGREAGDVTCTKGMEDAKKRKRFTVIVMCENPGQDTVVLFVCFTTSSLSRENLRHQFKSFTQSFSFYSLSYITHQTKSSIGLC